MTWTGWVTFAIALLGAALGLFNTWQGWRDRSVRLRVVPKYAEPVDGNMRRMSVPCISVEVQNLGTYPVTVEEVGLLTGRAKGNLPARAPFPPNVVVMGPRLPHRLERHDALTLVVQIDDLPPEDFTAAYARTAAGHLARGTTPALTDIAAAIRQATMRRTR
jgi:hypothetical protein